MAVSKNKYAYAVGRVRVLETRLFDYGRLDRMLEAATAEESLKVLAESSYGNHFAEATGVHDFEIILSKEMAYVIAEFEKMSPQPEMVALMALNQDFHNLKVLFKCKYLGRQGEEPLLPPGMIPLKRLRSGVEEENFRDLPPVIRRAAENILMEFALSPDPQLIELHLDRALFEMKLAVAREGGSVFLVELFQREIDLLNINTFLRVKKMGRSKEFLQLALLPGGLLEEALFLNLLGEGLEGLIDRLANSPYGEIAAEGIRGWMEEGSAIRLEKLADDYITGYLRQRKSPPFGLEPLIGYLWGKQIEIKNIRLILVGKINGLPVEAIRERLRHVYL
ncbi:MAG: V-type ATP synthase subunit C [Firmicutes bacterium]|nr:V-type ATP synthase subunit C [Bacillota bacterium]